MSGITFHTEGKGETLHIDDSGTLPPGTKAPSYKLEGPRKMTEPYLCDLDGAVMVGLETTYQRGNRRMTTNIYMDMNELIACTIQWARDKGILENGTRLGQAHKTLEEAQELVAAVENNNREEIIDAIGDVLVTVIIQADMNGLCIEDCLQSAYDVISKRTGRMENGVFVKDGGA